MVPYDLWVEIDFGNCLTFSVFVILLTHDFG